MKKIVLIIVFVQSVLSFAQQNSRNGYDLPPSGEIRAFVVFAEVVNHPGTYGDLDGWESGQMPSTDYIEGLFDHAFVNEASINGQVTKYLYEASFGELIFLADYYPNLVEIEYSALSGRGDTNVLDYLDNLSSPDIETANGYSINSGDFDLWTDNLLGRAKTNSSDDKIDYLVIFWWVNENVKERRGSGGISSYGNTIPLKDMIGSNYWTYACTGNPKGNLRHEYAHSLLGGNNFHSGGAGAGRGTFLSDAGGYSLLSSYNANIYFVNAWDRWRLGWKHSSNTFYISARSTTGLEVDADLVYGETLTDNEFVLRDFATYGDAIRIELPYLRSIDASTKKQYLWIENHQFLSDNVEYDSEAPKGIRLNIQVGNDDLTSFSDSRTNYLSPISSFGNYDYSYQISLTKALPNLPEPVEDYDMETAIVADADVYIASTYDELANPFTGNYLLEHHAFNFVNPNDYLGTSHYDEIFNMEYVAPTAIKINDEEILDGLPMYGNQYDAFPVNSKLNISTNPSSVPRLTYQTKSRNSKYSQSNPESTLTENNRYIFLNGLSIEILEQKANGDIKLEIYWNEFDITEDVRWCGSIVLNESVILNSNKTIVLDQGLSTTVPINPITFQSEQVFAEQTVFTCKNSSQFTLESNSIVELKNNSSFIMESGSLLEIDEGAKFKVKAGSTILIKSGADLDISSTGSLIIEDGGYICIESGANIDLEDLASKIKLLPNYNTGVNTSVLTNPGTCTTNLTSFSTTGNGSIVEYEDKYIQNETFTTNDHITGYNIYVGRNVTTSKPVGDVTINNGVEVIFEAYNDIIFSEGFITNSGGSFEMRIED